MAKKDKMSNNRTKIFLTILVLGIVVISAIGIFAYQKPQNIVVNNTIENNTTTNSESEIKYGYAPVKLAGLNFYAPEKYLKKYNSKDYFDAFPGEKDYEKTLNSKDDFESAFIDIAQLSFIDKYPSKIFQIDISYAKKYKEDLDEFDTFKKNSDLNRTITNKNIDGHIVKIIKTGSDFSRQTAGSNETYAYFELKSKSVLIQFTGIPIDEYMISSFFKLN
ncbi:hypothetical protein [Methanobrevibacter curvatus]|uniref:Uncharacterized protein n=1 Tax=Methanobrevibacter curvatus TaxID=49547 RepID=A0A166EIN5_9EURY|nr:hypothetical protein [Methanobrevibacter curvatus]KZX16694.1 hypothetical protein MBCUR_00350 [Methanobrevibacter curvatus]